MGNDKKILDCTAGGRMMWFDKENPLAVFTDIRTESHTLPNGQTIEIRPDMEAYFKKKYKRKFPPTEQLQQEVELLKFKNIATEIVEKLMS